MNYDGLEDEDEWNDYSEHCCDWLNDRLDRAAREVDSWSDEKKNRINYHYHVPKEKES